MYTITQDKKNIDGAVKTTYGIKCDEVSVKDVSPNKEEVTELIVICTPKVRHFWRCIFLWQRKGKNIENTRQNSNYLL